MREEMSSAFPKSSAYPDVESSIQRGLASRSGVATIPLTIVRKCCKNQYKIFKHVALSTMNSKPNHPTQNQGKNCFIQNFSFCKKIAFCLHSISLGLNVAKAKPPQFCFKLK